MFFEHVMYQTYMFSAVLASEMLLFGVFDWMCVKGYVFWIDFVLQYQRFSLNCYKTEHTDR